MAISKEEILSILPSKLDDESIRLLIDNISLVKFKVGQEIIEKSTIPARIFIIKSGYARLLGEFNNKLKSLYKFGVGSLLGHSSIINKIPIEHITATEDLIAYSIDQNIFETIYSKDKNFKSYIDQTIFPQEIFYILSIFLHKTPRTDFNVKDLFANAILNRL